MGFFGSLGGAIGGALGARTGGFRAGVGAFGPAGGAAAPLGTLAQFGGSMAPEKEAQFKSFLGQMGMGLNRPKPQPMNPLDASPQQWGGIEQMMRRRMELMNPGRELPPQRFDTLGGVGGMDPSGTGFPGGPPIQKGPLPYPAQMPQGQDYAQAQVQDPWGRSPHDPQYGQAPPGWVNPFGDNGNMKPGYNSRSGYR